MSFPRSVRWISFPILAFILILVLLVHSPFSDQRFLASAGAIAGCPVFPYDNIWNVPVDTLPLDPHSEAYVNTIGANKTVHPDFGSGIWEGGPIGIPFVTVGNTQARVAITFDYDDESDPGPYPIPPDAPIEGGPDSTGDRHILVVDQDNCALYELFNAWPQTDGSWQASSGAIFDLRSNALRPDGWTSADAAGLPILAGLVRYDEVASGEIRHALRFTVPQTRRAYVWPARHYASSLTGTQYPPMGQRFRLKADFDCSGFSSEVRVILTALKKYGMILADNGSAWYVSGVPDERWDNDDLHRLSQIPGSAFEAVDVSSLMIDPDSGQARVSAVRNDFNGDGQEDILWRHYGGGGANRVWFLGNSGEEGLPLSAADLQMSARRLVSRFAGSSAALGTTTSPQTKWLRPFRPRKATLGAVHDPRLAGGLNPRPAPAGISDPRLAGPVIDRRSPLKAPSEIAAAPALLGGADVMPVNDVNWQIVGTGDFDNDTHVDILWRNIASGTNVVWLMTGTGWKGSAELIPVADLSWQIAGTGDFDKDTHVDILWRNASSGENVIWYMNGTAWAGSALLLGVSDQNWQIVGTGDFNNDTHLDILWRYNGAGGYNVVWYMNNASWTGSAELISVADPTWQIAGTGDYDNNGRADILWRYNGVGGYNVIWYMNGVAWSSSAELIPVADLTWRIVSR